MCCRVHKIKNITFIFVIPERPFRLSTKTTIWFRLSLLYAPLTKKAWGESKTRSFGKKKNNHTGWIESARDFQTDNPVPEVSLNFLFLKPNCSATRRRRAAKQRGWPLICLNSRYNRLSILLENIQEFLFTWYRIKTTSIDFVVNLPLPISSGNRLAW